MVCCELSERTCHWIVNHNHDSMVICLRELDSYQTGPRESLLLADPFTSISLASSSFYARPVRTPLTTFLEAAVQVGLYYYSASAYLPSLFEPFESHSP